MKSGRICTFKCSHFYFLILYYTIFDVVHRARNTSDELKLYQINY
uniref:Uncharacterized protein n=1 Tax=Myoviridae sp. ctCo31 TaxID=2825053 RepID=A0A8S5UMR6_9CAUD|nr:MAG TPA: hypothetical protein [Myoviridae sp. ctCo31]